MDPIPRYSSRNASRSGLSSTLNPSAPLPLGVQGGREYGFFSRMVEQGSHMNVDRWHVASRGSPEDVEHSRVPAVVSHTDDKGSLMAVKVSHVAVEGSRAGDQASRGFAGSLCRSVRNSHSLARSFQRGARSVRSRVRRFSSGVRRFRDRASRISRIRARSPRERGSLSNPCFLRSVACNPTGPTVRRDGEQLSAADWPLNPKPQTT